MLLSEYMIAKGDAEVGVFGAPHLGPLYRTFVFGEEYKLSWTLTGGEYFWYPFTELDEALDVLRSEFEADPGHLPDIQVVSYTRAHQAWHGSSPLPLGTLPHTPPSVLTAFLAGNAPPTFGAAAERVLSVRRVPQNPHFEAPPIEAYVKQIREAVLYYSVAGTWDGMDGRSNL